MTDEPERLYDAYRSCGNSCTHDLARGVLTSQLRGGDGPEKPVWDTVGMGLAAWVAQLHPPQEG